MKKNFSLWRSLDRKQEKTKTSYDKCKIYIFCSVKFFTDRSKNASCLRRARTHSASEKENFKKVFETEKLSALPSESQNILVSFKILTFIVAINSTFAVFSIIRKMFSANVKVFKVYSSEIVQLVNLQ